MANNMRYVDLDYCIQQSILYESGGAKYLLLDEIAENYIEFDEE